MFITVFTIAYNGYGKFLPQWINNIKNQKMLPSEIIIVLGKNHGADLKYLESNNVRIIKSNSDVMGTLRNLAIKEINTEWMLYFSVDDELKSNAIDQIYKKKNRCDAVTLKYIEHKLDSRRIIKYSANLSIDNIMNWRATHVPGYIAVKRKYKNKILYYEDIEIPNYPYLFMLAYLGLVVLDTDEIVAAYIKRRNSHGDLAAKSKTFKSDYVSFINERALFYYNKYQSNYNKRIRMKKVKRMLMHIEKPFRDEYNNHRYRQGKNEEMPYDVERKKRLEKSGFATYISSREEVVYYDSSNSN